MKTKKKRMCIAAIVVLALLACEACSSGTQMYQHKRSDCDCPTF